jgi:hypothetical protein
MKEEEYAVEVLLANLYLNIDSESLKQTHFELNKFKSIHDYLNSLSFQNIYK